MTFRLMTAATLSLALMACGGESPEETSADMPAQAEAPETSMQEMAGPSLQEVAADEARRDAGDMARDQYRHPVETLEFFGLEPGMTVVEISPGGGWYTDILAPYVGLNGGTYIAASYDPANERSAPRLEAFRDKYMTGDYGDVQLTVFSREAATVAPDGSADMVLTFRNVHNWLMSSSAEESFEKFYAALKPGGTLGVVEHRLPEEADSALEQTSGYVKESTIIAMAEAAGFELAGKSEINANPDDTADHPFGVWTLPPTSRTADRNGNAPEGFDAEHYLAIGESDRMTLKFVKPAN